MGRSGRGWTRTVRARLLLAGLLVAVVLPPGSAAAGTPGWAWPLRPVPDVVREAAIPPSPWLPGHRGVDLAATPGQVVLAPAAGVVTFAGRVVDRGVLSVGHGGGLRSSVEPVDPLVGVGVVVQRGDPIARLSAGPGHCAPGACLHWGVRRGDAYVDPLTLLGRLDPPVLLPLGPLPAPARHRCVMAATVGHGQACWQ